MVYEAEEYQKPVWSFGTKSLVEAYNNIDGIFGMGTTKKPIEQKSVSTERGWMLGILI